jgi:hypothetical protein
MGLANLDRLGYPGTVEVTERDELGVTGVARGDELMLPAGDGPPELHAVAKQMSPARNRRTDPFHL